MSLSPLYRAINRSHSLLLEAMTKEIESDSCCFPAFDEISPALGHLIRASEHAFKRDSVLIAQALEKANIEGGFQEIES